MKLFAYTIRGARAAEPHIATTSKRGVSVAFRLVDAKERVKFLGTAFFKTDKTDKKGNHFADDTLLPLSEFGSAQGCTHIQYLQDDDTWKTM